MKNKIIYKNGIGKFVKTYKNDIICIRFYLITKGSNWASGKLKRYRNN